MTGDLTATAFAAATLFLFSSCGHFSQSGKAEIEEPTTPVAENIVLDSTTPLPERDESISFHGPGSDEVDKTRFPAIRFDSDSYDLPENAATTLDSVVAHLKSTGASAILAGFTDPDEENRVLGERRALAVRQGLIERGANPNLLQTVSYGHDFPPSTGKPDRRVEFGLISTAHTAAAPTSTPVAATP